jgi:hypothetical protein
VNWLHDLCEFGMICFSLADAVASGPSLYWLEVRMSYVIAAPEIMTSAATDVASIGSTLNAANAGAAAPTTGIVVAAEDEVSAAIAELFSSHGQAFQALSAQSAAFHCQIVQALNAGAGAYASTETASAGPLQTLAQNLPVPNAAVSVGGFTLLRLGSATASSDPLTWGIAIAFGANSTARVTGDADALAFGANSLAEASTLNLATATGTNSVAFANQGYLNQASALGPNSAAYAQTGNLQTANALGAHTTASAVNGTLDIAQAMGPGSTAVAGGGTNAVAIAGGPGSTAVAGASPTTPGNVTFAAAIGTMLDATATGKNFLVNIVFQP